MVSYWVPSIRVSRCWTSIDTQPSSATRARSPRVKPMTSGMWAYTLLATTRSAGPCSFRTAEPVSGVRKAVRVGTPASFAA